MSLPTVVDLGLAPPAAAALVGDKAASLSRLASLGLRVPRAWAVTTSAFAQFCEYNGLQPDGLEDAAARQTLGRGRCVLEAVGL